MPLPNKTWTTSTPTAQDSVGVEQPDLVNDSSPGALDGHRFLVEHLHALRNKLQNAYIEIGDNPGNLPSGSLRARVAALESAGSGGQTDTVAGQNGCSNTGDNVDAMIEPTYGSTTNTVCEGNDSRLSDSRTPTAHALDDVTLHSATTDITTHDATTAKHGLLPKLGGGTTNFLRADGTWASPPGGASPLTTKGDLYGFDTGDNRLPIGTDDYVLTADSTADLGVAWKAVAGGGSTPHEEEFATTGAETPGDTVSFGALNATPRGASLADTPSGYDLHIFRNGVRMKYSATPATYQEYFYDIGNNEIDILASGSADDYEVVYGS